MLAFCLALDLTAALSGGLLSIPCVWLLARHMGWSGAQARDALIFCLAAVLTVRSAAVGILRLHDRFNLGAAADATTPLVRCAGALIAVATGATVQSFLLAWAAAEIVTASAYWILAARTAAPLQIFSLRGASRAPGDHVGIWPFTWTTNLAATLNVLSRQVVVVVIGAVAGPVAAGDYRLAYQVSQALVSVSEMGARAAFAEFGRNQALPALRQMFRRLTYLAAAAALAGAMLVLLGGPALLLVAGAGHQGALLPLRLLGTACAIDLAAVGFEPVLLTTGRPGLALVLRLCATACLVAGVAVLLPRYGAPGVVAATLAASACAALLFGTASYRQLRR